MRFVKLAGTWLPLVLTFSFFAMYFDARFSVVTWERPLIYALATVGVALGVEALISMARLNYKGYPSFYLLLMIYKNALQVVLFLSAFQFSVALLYTDVPAILSPDMSMGLLVATIASMGTTGLALFLGRRRGVLDIPVDPVPFRPLLRRWRNRNRRG